MFNLTLVVADCARVALMGPILPVVAELDAYVPELAPIVQEYVQDEASEETDHDYSDDECGNYLHNDDEELYLVWSFESGEDECMTLEEWEANIALGDELLAMDDGSEAEEERARQESEELARPDEELVHEFGRTYTLEEWDSLMGDYDLPECAHEDTIPTREDGQCLWFGGANDIGAQFTSYPDGGIVWHWVP